MGYRRPDRDEDLQVWLDGVQRAHRIDRYIVVNQLHADYPITAEQARELTTALIAAADECEQMAGYDRIVV